MHIFKNVGSGIWEHVIGKRDNVGVREDLQVVGRMRQAWPREEGGHVRLPPAPWIISKKEEKQVKQAITTLRTPTGFMRSLKGAFTTTKKRGVEQLYGLKSHDWHKMLQVSVFQVLYVEIKFCNAINHTYMCSYVRSSYYLLASTIVQIRV